MPRLKDKPVVLDERKFVEWLLEVYYYRMMDQGMTAAATPLLLASAGEEPTSAFLTQIRAQLTCFELTFPLIKLPFLYQQALRQISPTPGAVAAG